MNHWRRAISRDRAPASATWDAGAVGGARNLETANVEFTSYDASSGKGSRMVGTNILAFQILNAGVSSSDLLCIPQLTYGVEVSSGLDKWTTIGDALVSANGDIELRKASVPLGEPQQFLRLKVSR